MEASDWDAVGVPAFAALPAWARRIPNLSTQGKTGPQNPGLPS